MKKEEFYKFWESKDFKSFYIKKPFVSLVGSSSNFGYTFGDLDLLIYAKELGIFAPVIFNTLSEQFGSYLARRIQLLPNLYETPFTNYIEIFDLKIAPIEISKSLSEINPGHSSGAVLDTNEFLERLHSGILFSDFIYRKRDFEDGFLFWIRGPVPFEFQIPTEFRLYRMAPKELWTSFKFEYGDVPPKSFEPVFSLILEKRKDPLFVEMQRELVLPGIRLPEGGEYIRRLSLGDPAVFCSRRQFRKNIGVEVALVSEGFAHGIVIVKEPVQVGSFREAEELGWMPEKFRNEFAGERGFFVYGLDLIQEFVPPRVVSGVERGERLWLGDVTVLGVSRHRIRGKAIEVLASALRAKPIDREKGKPKEMYKSTAWHPEFFDFCENHKIRYAIFSHKHGLVLDSEEFEHYDEPGTLEDFDFEKIKKRVKELLVSYLIFVDFRALRDSVKHFFEKLKGVVGNGVKVFWAKSFPELLHLFKLCEIYAKRGYYEFQAAISPEAEKQAEKAKQLNRITWFEFFYPLKSAVSAIQAYRRAEVFRVERMLEELREIAQKRDLPTEIVPVYIEKKYDGLRQVIFKKGNRVLVLTDGGFDSTKRFPSRVDFLQKLDVDFILDTETEMWIESEHQPREVVSGYVNAKTPPDDSNITFNVFDVLAYSGKVGKELAEEIEFFQNEGIDAWREKFGHKDVRVAYEVDVKLDDMHEFPLALRLKIRKHLPFEISVIEKPPEGTKFNICPSYFADSLREAEKFLLKVSEAENSEGAMVKFWDSLYPLNAFTYEWLKLKKYAEVHGIVWNVIETKTPGVYNADFAVSFPEGLLVSEEDIVEVKGKKYLNVGRTFNTAVPVKVGDIIAVRFHAANLYRDPKTGRVRLHFYENIFHELRPDEEYPDSFETALQVSRESGLLVEKFEVVRQVDPYLLIPPEGPKYLRATQAHARGKSIHWDLRFENDVMKRWLIGFTLAVQIPETVKEVITTQEQLDELLQDPDVWKINPITGEFRKREIRGGVVRRTAILAFRKQREPYEWLTFEGITPPGEVGATRFYPGVFRIFEKGHVEYGAQKTNFHEYWFWDGIFLGRYIFRITAGILRDVEPNEFDPCEEGSLWLVDVGGAFDFYLQRPGEQLKECKILSSKESYNFFSQILPPSEEIELREPAWLFIQADPEPYVLSDRAVSLGWMPPLGVSALPRHIRRAVPPEYQYWKEEIHEGSEDKARYVRDQLVASIKGKETEITFLRHIYVIDKIRWLPGISLRSKAEMQEILDMYRGSVDAYATQVSIGRFQKRFKNFGIMVTDEKDIKRFVNVFWLPKYPAWNHGTLVHELMHCIYRQKKLRREFKWLWDQWKDAAMRARNLPRFLEVLRESQPGVFPAEFLSYLAEFYVMKDQKMPPGLWRFARFFDEIIDANPELRQLFFQYFEFLK